MIAHDGQLTRLRQVAIFGYQRVDLGNRTKAIDLGGRDTGRPPVAGLHVEVMEVPVVGEFIADDMQEVVVEDGGIGSPDHERAVSLILDLGELRAEAVGQFRPLDIHLQLGISRRHLIEYGLPHQPQHLVLRVEPVLLHLVHGGLQRVGGYLCHHLGSLQFSLQQLSIGFLLRGLLHNLLKHLILRLGQIFLFCLFHLIPE